MTKYIFVSGGVMSGVGKGVTSASIGLLMKCRGLKTTYMKLDPYLNVNSGLLAPREHGECFLCDDGTETDLDLGHAERLMGISTGSDNICTSGTLYKELIIEQERGDYLGETIQFGHVANNIIKKMKKVGEGHDVVICEIGGTISDIESGAFYKAMVQMKMMHPNDVITLMVAPILWVPTIKEWKTKPLQRSVSDLMSYGIQPDILVCRVEREIDPKILDKISDNTYIPRDRIFDAPDAENIYKVPIEFYNRQLDDLVCDLLRLKRSGCRIKKYKDLIESHKIDEIDHINIGVFGKYTNCDEAYISIKEALFHAGVHNNVKVNIKWISSQDLENYKGMRGVKNYFDDLSGMIVPGGFDNRGVEGKIKAIRYARENRVPFLGICLGLQSSVIEFSRNVCKLEDSDSKEWSPECKNPVVTYLDGQQNIVEKSGTMRLGSYDCILDTESISYSLYKKKNIRERHRHRLEVNSEYLEEFEKHGFKVVGRNPETNLVEIMELDQDIHPFFVGIQAHPEFKSKLLDPASLFNGLIQASIKYYKDSNTKSETIS